MSRTRVVFPSDNHSGHRSGLTPPAWQYRSERDDARGEVWAAYQGECWNAWTAHIESIRPIHVAVHVGDAIDGGGIRSSGTELITADLEEQTDIAYHALKIIEPERGWALVYGTPYHTAGGDSTDHDRRVASLLGGEIHSHLFAEIDGVMFDVKHHIGGSQSPTGGDIALRKEILHNREWWLAGIQPKADWLIRGHVHRLRQVDNVFTCPSLQGWTKFGGRRCSNVVHWGLLWCDIEDREVTWHWTKKTIQAGKCRTVTF